MNTLFLLIRHLHFKVIFLVVTFCLLMATSSFAHAKDIAVIVNNENPTDEISFKDLVKILKQEKQYWRSGEKIYLVMQEAGTREKSIVLERVYKMDDLELKKFWLAKLFKGEISSFPKTLGSNEAAKRFVSHVPNAIAFINSSYIDESIKVLRIEGKLPDDEDYILAERAGDED